MWITIRTYTDVPVDEGEILRYAGVRSDEGGENLALVREMLPMALSAMRYSVAYAEFKINRTGDTLELGFLSTDSADLKKCLLGCEGVLVFAATVGVEIDRLITKYSSISPAKALILQAIGAERIESLCNLFTAEIAREKAALGLSLRPRFSPGYGDFPLEAQREIFEALDCPRKIGLSLNESLLMSPSKSVTAIVGIYKNR